MINKKHTNNSHIHKLSQFRDIRNNKLFNNKNLIILILGILYSGCTFSSKVIEVKNNDASAFYQSGDVGFADSCIVISANTGIKMLGSYKNFELSFECKTGDNTIAADIYSRKQELLN